MYSVCDGKEKLIEVPALLILAGFWYDARADMESIS